jgi:putative ABC transport system substrate-binding protein
MKKSIVAALALALFSLSLLAHGQRSEKLYRIGAILQGGSYWAAIEGLREGMRASGLVEGKHWLLDVRETKGELALVEPAARELAQAQADLIFTLAGSVTRKAVGMTGSIPIVFAVGSDPVGLGLVQSLAPGVPRTGIHFLLTDLTAKRLQLLKELIPEMRSVVTFYDPRNKGAGEAARLARESAASLHLQLIERHVRSVEDLQRGLRALRIGEADAYFFTSDAMVASQAQLIIDTARDKRMPTMFHEQSLVAQGGLASYGFSFREVGRMAAKYVIRIFRGARAEELPIERVDRLEFAVNLKTARDLGVTIPPSLLARADEVVERGLPAPK